MRRQIHRRAGFTLVELVIAVLIMAILMLLAVPSMEGVLADRRLRRSLDGFNKIVREAQERSIAERRPYLIVWFDGKVGLRAEGLARGEAPEPAVKMGDKTQFRSSLSPNESPFALLANTPLKTARCRWSKEESARSSRTFRGFCAEKSLLKSVTSSIDLEKV